jgi:hypothetical protein
VFTVHIPPIIHHLIPCLKFIQVAAPIFKATLFNASMDAANNGENDEHRKDCEKNTAQPQTEASLETSLNDNDDEHDSDTSSIGVPLVMVCPSTGLPVVPLKAERPPDGLEWNDAAILDCWNLAVTTHDQEQPMEWQAPSLVNREDHEFLVNWKPRSFPLPLWAVDAFSHP